MFSLLTAAWLGAVSAAPVTLLPDRAYDRPAFLRVDPARQGASAYAQTGGNSLTWPDYSGAAIETDAALRPRYPGMWHTMAPEYGDGPESVLDMRSGVSGASSGTQRVGTQGTIRIGGDIARSNVGGKFYQALAGYPDDASQRDLRNYYTRLYAMGGLDDPIYPYELNANEPALGEPWGGEVPYQDRPTPGHVPEPPYPEPPPSEYNVEDFDAISHRGDEPERGVGNVVFGEVRRDPLFDRLRDGTQRARIANYQNRVLMQHIEADRLLETGATFQRRLIYATLTVGSIAILGAVAAGFSL